MDLELEVQPDLDPRGFEVEVRSLADSLSHGTSCSRHRGAGLDYVQSRLHVEGDSERDVDWKATARTGRLFVSEFETLRSIDLYLVVDCSGSMTVGAHSITKYAWAVRLAGAFALSALDRLSPVGVASMGTRDVFRRATRSRQAMRLWLTELRRYRQDDSGCLARSLAAVDLVARYRSTIIILSDLHEPEALPELESAAVRHECIVLKLRDPAERAVPTPGFIRAMEAETGRQVLLNRSVPPTESETLLTRLASLGADSTVIDVDGPVAADVAKLLAARHSSRTKR